jgi:DNA-binding NarL/FixJ family response regulator
MTAQPTVIIVDDDPGISAIRTCWTQFSWVWSEIARLENEKATAALRALRYSHPREPEVMALVVTGRLNKQTAYDIGISDIPVKVHRGQVMRKMKADLCPTWHGWPTSWISRQKHLATSRAL